MNVKALVGYQLTRVTMTIFQTCRLANWNIQKSYEIKSLLITSIMGLKYSLDFRQKLISWAKHVKLNFQFENFMKRSIIFWTLHCFNYENYLNFVILIRLKKNSSTCVSGKKGLIKSDSALFFSTWDNYLKFYLLWYFWMAK